MLLQEGESAAGDSPPFGPSASPRREPEKVSKLDRARDLADRHGPLAARAVLGLLIVATTAMAFFAGGTWPGGGTTVGAAAEPQSLTPAGDDPAGDELAASVADEAETDATAVAETDNRSGDGGPDGEGGDAPGRSSGRSSGDASTPATVSGPSTTSGEPVVPSTRFEPEPPTTAAPTTVAPTTSSAPTTEPTTTTTEATTTSAPTTIAPEPVALGGWEDDETSRWTLYPTGSVLGAWTVVEGSVDTISTAEYQFGYGGRAIDIIGASPGVLQREVSVTPGVAYRLDILLAENTNCGPAAKSVAIDWNGERVFTRTVDAPFGSSELHRIDLPPSPTEVAILTLRSVDTPGGCGVLLDAPSIVPVG